MVLGYQNLRSLVMVTSTTKFLGRDFSSYGHDPRGRWRHSVSVGAAAKRLANELGENPITREKIFIAGLLHDIGKMILHAHLSSYTDAEIGSYDSLCAAETDLLGMNHAEAGALVGEKWNLDPLVCDVLGGHHGGPSNPLASATSRWCAWRMQWPTASELAISPGGSRCPGFASRTWSACNSTQRSGRRCGSRGSGTSPRHNPPRHSTQARRRRTGVTPPTMRCPGWARTSNSPPSGT